MSRSRENAIELNKEEFRQIGHALIDAIADFNATIRERPVTPGESGKRLQQLLEPLDLPELGTSASQLVSDTTELLFNHSLLNGHPKFMGYITASAAPMGVLADLLAAAVNPNVGAQILSPVATEIEKQTIRWLAQFIGLTTEYGGILVSGGNMANITAFLAARHAKVTTAGKEAEHRRPRVYCPQTTHTWIEKAVGLTGMEADAIRWIPVNKDNKMDTVLLEKALSDDRGAGWNPFMVIGTAGDVSTGAVDDLSKIAAIARANDLWFHIDGAYGIPAAGIPEFTSLFEGMEDADSIALDPHKWLYMPLEAGCTLVKNAKHLTDTFSSHPVYYNFNKDEEAPSTNYYEFGLQNSRGFRALKIWLTLRQMGRAGYLKSIMEDIELSRLMFHLADIHPHLEAVSQSLSITTLRFIPTGLDPSLEKNRPYLNKLNEAVLDALQKGGKAFLSNAVIREKYCLRGCIVNFRTSRQDIEDILELIVQTGYGILKEWKAPQKSGKLSE